MVNCSQSTNDIYPTALRIALYTMLGQLTGDMAYLQQGFAAKSEEFSDVIKMGRTQLQDAVPMTLGQEFGAYATTIGEDILRVEESRKLLLEVNLGATAIGTSINAPKGYAEVASKALAEVSAFRWYCPPTSSKRRGTPGPMCRPPACSSASRSSCPRSAMTCACCPPARDGHQ